MLITRGVPGTHDITLLLEKLNSLYAQQPGQSVCLPRFNKALDDRYSESNWKRINGRCRRDNTRRVVRCRTSTRP